VQRYIFSLEIQIFLHFFVADDMNLGMEEYFVGLKARSFSYANK